MANRYPHPGILGCSEWIINGEDGVQSQTHTTAAVLGRSQLSILSDDSAGFCTKSAIVESPSDQ